MAFHLGCLRALHDRALLERVKVVSGISGGALLAAMWAYGPADFCAFDEMTVDRLRRGLQWRLARRVLTPVSIVSAATSTATVAARRHGGRDELRLRKHTRTERFVDVLRSEVFQNTLMTQAHDPGLAVVITAADMRSGGAVRFGSDISAASRLGDIVDDIDVATAVGASAAYPLLLPALERTYTFERRNGTRRRRTVLLSDGGVYDNLGLSVLEPGRSRAFTSHVYDVDYIVSCDAGRHNAPRTPRFWPGRTARAFEIVHRRGQDHGRGRLHEWQASHRIRGFVMPYLAMDDARLPIPIADLVCRDTVALYPTNFAAMGADDVSALTTRGEQLTRCLLPAYCPELA